MKTGVQSISRRLITTSLILSIYLSFSSSSIWLASAEDNLCEPLPIDSADYEFELGTALNVSISGFKASITYVSSTNNEAPVAKITAASEVPIVNLEDGTLTIHTATCIDGTASPTLSPTMTSAARAPALGIVTMSFLAGGTLPLLIAWAPLLSLLTGVGAQSDTTTTCTPTIELEIGIPYECPYDNFVDGACLTPRQIADKTVQALFVDFDVNAAQSLLAEDYIQHNPGVPTGAAPVLGFIPALEASGLAIETHRTIAQGNLVAYHSTYTNATLFGGDTLIGFDVFRVENGKVQEHWDNLQELAGPNPNGNTMVDGPTMIKYLSETEANTERALGLVNGVLVGGNASLAPLYISTEEYTQHNPTIADGLDGLAAALENLAAQGLSFTYDSIELVVAEGNFVLTGSPGEFGAGNPTAYYDLFRLEDGLIVEHWDVIQPIPPAAEFAHDNGKF